MLPAAIERIGVGSPVPTMAVNRLVDILNAVLIDGLPPKRLVTASIPLMSQHPGSPSEPTPSANIMTLAALTLHHAPIVPAMITFRAYAGCLRSGDCHSILTTTPAGKRQALGARLRTARTHDARLVQRRCEADTVAGKTPQEIKLAIDGGHFTVLFDDTGAFIKQSFTSVTP